MIYFEINGKRVAPNKIKNTLEKAFLQNIEAQIRQKVGSIRNPETGEFPAIVLKGSSIDNLSFHIEGSPDMIALVRAKLGINDNQEIIPNTNTNPIAFLSYAFEDTKLAERIALALQNNGIETWWADWCINSGDSLRQKIEEGLGACTHFIVLLTPTSINKPWVNAEIDAGFARQLEQKCRLIPLRSGLSASELSPFLKTLRSPEVNDLEADIAQLIHDIHGITRKPTLGKAPAIVREAQNIDSGYSAAAMAIAKVFVEKSETGTFADPQLSQQEVQELTGLSGNDMEDSLYELSGYFNTEFEGALPKDEFFAEFDKFWKPWNPQDDALRLAADMVNDNDFPEDTPKIAALYGWDARRLNPAISYLVARGAIQPLKVMGAGPWVSPQIWSTADTRRFVKSRS